jgi:CBS domain-containing protein
MDDGGGGGDSNMYNFSPASAYDPFTLADVLNSKTAAVVSGFEEASATPPSSVVAVEAETTIREALDELAVSEIRALPVRDKETGVVLGFFDATQALAVALAAAGGTESERTVLEQPVSSLIDPRFDAGRRGDGGTLPFACADLPLRRGPEGEGEGGRGGGTSSFFSLHMMHGVALKG